MGVLLDLLVKGYLYRSISPIREFYGNFWRTDIAKEKP